LAKAGVGKRPAIETGKMWTRSEFRFSLGRGLSGRELSRFPGRKPLASRDATSRQQSAGDLDSGSGSLRKDSLRMGYGADRVQRGTNTAP